MYHLTEAYLLASFISVMAAGWGALALGGAVMPSVLQQSLAPHQAKAVMHSYWRRYFRWAIIASLVATLVIAVTTPFSALPRIYSLLVTAIAASITSCFFVAGIAVHRGLARALIACALLLGLVLLAAMIYVLPGQFTFWPTSTA